MNARTGCKDLNPNFPGLFGKPRGPVLCVLYPNCECGRIDGHQQQGFREAMQRLDKLTTPSTGAQTS